LLKDHLIIRYLGFDSSTHPVKILKSELIGVEDNPKNCISEMTDQLWSWIGQEQALSTNQVALLSSVMELQRLQHHSSTTTTNQRLAYLAHRLDIIDRKDTTSYNTSLFITEDDDNEEEEVSDDEASPSDRLNVQDPQVRARLDTLKKERNWTASFMYVKDASNKKGEFLLKIGTGYNTQSEHLSIINAQSV
jgi:hypothetical protein